MANSVAQDIATLLDANTALVLGSTLFGGAWGDDNIDEQTLVLETGGIDTLNKYQYEQPTFQILQRGVRQGSSNLAYTALRSVHTFLIAQPELVTINGADYLGFEPISSIAGLGRDKNGRFLYTMNYSTFRNAD